MESNFNTFDNDNLISVIQQKSGIIGSSPLIKEAVVMLMQAAPTELNVLINGETGTGKEVFAHAIHGLSSRKKMSFISVNCGAISESLLESELFGHEKGSFTGAYEQRRGFFEEANKGTIFLDEIGEMPIGTQVKLLRVLESGEFSRIGSPVVHKVDVRVIAATHRDLRQEVKKGNFRQDLYFRLKNVQILLPALRNHTEDIPQLIDHFANLAAKKNALQYHGYDPDILPLLTRQSWQGNVREFKNFIDTLVALERVEYITLADVRKYITPALPPAEFHEIPESSSLVHVERYQNNQSPETELSLIFRTLLQIQSEINGLKIMNNRIVEDISEIKNNINLQPAEIQEVVELGDKLQDMSLADMEKLMIEEALKRHKNNRRAAAIQLGISERTLYRKISEYELE